MHRTGPRTRALKACALMLAILLVSAQALRAQSFPELEGHWEGAVELPGQHLEIRLDFSHEDRMWIGSITIPAQNARGLALEKIDVKRRQVTFAISKVPGEPVFKGEISEDGRTMSGTFTQGGQSFPFEVAAAPPPAAKAAGSLEDIGKIVDAALADWKTPGMALAVVTDGKVVLARGFGLRDVEAKKPVTADTLFAIGSCTKAFTSFLLGRLVDAGKLDWDEPLAGYLPGFKLYDDYVSAHLTPRDMLSHRSGLPRHDLVWYNNLTITRGELVHRLRYLRPNKELREAWQYNNLMYLAAGYLSERLSGKSWEDEVREEIFEPLGMTRSNLSVEDSKADSDHAEPYLEDDGVVRKVDFRPTGAMGPAGSINSTASDMAQWVRLNLSDGEMGGKRLIAARTLEELHSPQMSVPGLPSEPEASPVAYAFGWFVDMYRGHLRVSHGGNIDGFSALVTLYPVDGAGVVALVNKNASALPDLVSRTVADRVLGLPSKDWIGEAAVKRDRGKAVLKEAEAKKGLFRVKGTTPSRKLEEFAGLYENPGYGMAEIRGDDDRLVLVYNGMSMPLVHWNYDVFRVAESKKEIIPENLTVNFESDDSGQIASFSSPFEPMVDPIVFERLPDPKLKDPAFLSRLVGEYELPGQILDVSLKGNVLVLQATNQPAFELAPAGTGRFDLKGLNGYSARFTLPETGPATSILLVQPNGVFEAKRKGASNPK